MALDKQPNSAVDNNLESSQDFELVEKYEIPAHICDAAQKSEIAQPGTENPAIEDWNAQQFAIAAHQAYELASEAAVKADSEIEREVEMTQTDGAISYGRVDFMSSNQLIDFKTHYMPKWSESDATRYAKEHGQQMAKYVASPDTPEGAQGTIIVSVPPESQSVRDAYEQGLSNFGVKVQYAENESPETIGKMVADIVKGSEVEEHLKNNDG
jgi:hypothetical protein